jgi:subtilase family serine protease
MLSGSRLVPALAAGAQSAGTVTLTVPTSATGGNYYLLACADDTSVITESDETNNCKAAAGRVVIGQADLVTSALSNPPATAKRGTGFAVTDTALNQGDAGAVASTTRYYMSLNTARDTADRMMIGTRAVDPVGPGATDAGTVNVVIPSTLVPGAYYVLACADDTSRVAESGGSNNCRASATKVQVTQ